MNHGARDTTLTQATAPASRPKGRLLHFHARIDSRNETPVRQLPPRVMLSTVSETAPRGLARNTSCLRVERSPPASPAHSPALRSRRIARRNVVNDGTAPGGDRRAARSASTRCTAATFPRHRPSNALTSSVTTNRSARASRTPGTIPGPGTGAASHRNTVRSETPNGPAASRTCSVDKRPLLRSSSSRPTTVGACSAPEPVRAPGMSNCCPVRVCAVDVLPKAWWCAPPVG